MLTADVPDRRLGAADENEEQPLGNLGFGQIFLGQLVLAFPGWTIDNRDAIGLRIPANATAEAARQAHQVSVVQRFIRPGQGPPP